KIYLDESIEEGKTQKQILYRRVLQDILDSLGESLDLQEHVHQRLKGGSPAQRSSLQATLLKMSNSITATVIKPWDSIFKSTDKKEVIVQTGVEDEDSGTPKYFLTVQLRQGTELYQIEERSLGFKWFFAFLLFTEYRKNRSTDKGQTLFLVDEPASNLHSTMQEKLTDKFESIVDKSHLIYTTHSQHLINPMWLESTFIVINKSINYADEMQSDTKQTDIEVTAYKQFAAENPNQKDYFQPILDALDYKPSRLELVPKILVVEGKNDYYTLRYMLEVVLKKKMDYSLYPGNGAKGNSQVISLYTAWARDFKVLLDADSAGQKAKEFYEDKFGNLVKDKIFTLSDIGSTWKNKAMEELFTATEQMSIIQTLYPRRNKYSKESFNLAIQNLLYKKTLIGLNQSTKDRFQKIYDFFEK
ncbi:MAG: AAA family ATPase, partial [Candidatus Saccharibacteria bacterium]|nr:AAA family ATPase [Candidatus Saccharibacteria bacterium]